MATDKETGTPENTAEQQAAQSAPATQKENILVTILLWPFRKILFIILWPFRKLFAAIGRLLKRMFASIAKWCAKRAARIAAWMATTLKNSLTWSTGDSTENSVVMFLVRFRPIVILLIAGYLGRLFFSDGEGLSASLVFFSTQLVVILVTMVLFYVRPTRSTFIPHLYYNLRTLFLAALCGYLGYLMVKYQNHWSAYQNVDIYINLLAIMLTGIIPYFLGQYCDFVWDRFSSYLSPEQQKALKDLAITNPNDVLKAQKTLKDADLLDNVIDELPQDFEEAIEEQRRRAGLGEKALIMTEILFRRGWRFIKRRKKQKLRKRTDEEKGPPKGAAPRRKVAKSN